MKLPPCYRHCLALRIYLVRAYEHSLTMISVYPHIEGCLVNAARPGGDGGGGNMRTTKPVASLLDPPPRALLHC